MRSLEEQMGVCLWVCSEERDILGFLCVCFGDGMGWDAQGGQRSVGKGGSLVTVRSRVLCQRASVSHNRSVAFCSVGKMEKYYQEHKQSATSGSDELEQDIAKMFFASVSLSWVETCTAR